MLPNGCSAISRRRVAEGQVRALPQAAMSRVERVFGGKLMASERSVGVVWSEETENGVVLHMRGGTGADVMLTLPNAAVAAQAEAQLRSVLAMATMQFQRRVAKVTTSGGTLWEGFMPEMVSRARGRLSAWG